jgi:hypothetical protein
MQDIKFRQWTGYNFHVWGTFRGEFRSPINVGRNSEQFTGLQDKNGREICEGDLLIEDAPRGNKYHVIRVKGGFAINTFQDEIATPMFFESLGDMQTQGYVTSQCSIIGNIHETPELLKK